jgi:hypothetical protein
MKQEALVHLVPTTTVSNRSKMLLLTHFSKRLLFEQIGITRNDTVQPCHLHITSDEEVEENNWQLHIKHGIVSIGDRTSKNNIYLKKIIASTNPTIKDKAGYTDRFSPYDICDTFLQLYAERYTASNPIKKVELEMEIGMQGYHEAAPLHKRLEYKLDSQGCVIVKPTSPASPQQEGERLLQEVIRVIDTLRILNKKEEDATAIDAGLYKAQMIVFQVMDLLTTPSPSNEKK